MTKALTAADLKSRYGRFYKRRRLVSPTKLPPELRPLAPFAEVWGVGDDYEREELVDSAPKVAQDDLFALFQNKVLYRTTVDWLAKTADALAQSDEFQGVSCLLLS